MEDSSGCMEGANEEMKFKVGDTVRYEPNDPPIPGVVENIVGNRVHVHWSNGIQITYRNNPSLLLMTESTVGMTGMALAVREAVDMLEGNK